MNYTGILVKCIAYNSDEERIAKGYTIHYHKPNGDMRQSFDLFDDNGNLMPPGWYQLKETGEYQLVVVNRSI